MSLTRCVAVYLIAVMLSCVIVNNAQSPSATTDTTSGINQTSANGNNTANQTTIVNQSVLGSPAAASPGSTVGSLGNAASGAGSSAFSQSSSSSDSSSGSMISPITQMM